MNRLRGQPYWLRDVFWLYFFSRHTLAFTLDLCPPRVVKEVTTVEVGMMEDSIRVLQLIPVAVQFNAIHRAGAPHRRDACCFSSKTRSVEVCWAPPLGRILRTSGALQA
jgi:hypothetical protein